MVKILTAQNTDFTLLKITFRWAQMFKNSRGPKFQNTRGPGPMSILNFPVQRSLRCMKKESYEIAPQLKELLGHFSPCSLTFRLGPSGAVLLAWALNRAATTEIIKIWVSLKRFVKTCKNEIMKNDEMGLGWR